MSRKIFFFIIFLLAFAQISTLYGQNTGVTGIDFSLSQTPVASQPAIMGAVKPPALKQTNYYQSPWLKYTDEWLWIASDSLDTFVPECFQFSVYFNPGDECLYIDNPMQELSSTQEAAIARTPAWLRADLYDNFRRFYYSFLADSVALAILNAPDPYVDEVAFQAAHVAPAVLSGFMPFPLLLENAQGVYSADTVLEYVEIVDYGNSNDDDYWSTARYNIIEESGDTVQIEIDREIYYWYIVHPKLSDEMPTYINPQNSQAANPPAGVFWRDYLWNHADPGYPLLRDYFEGCTFLWRHLTNTAGDTNGAVGLVNDWINEVMNWGAGAERPIQPVRIYALHCGNCGEYSDITAAAGRIALIPTICTTNFCEDHTWDEFWDREWIAWEPVNTYVNSPLVYENGWGKVLSAVFDWRGDGYVWTCTERYSEGVCTLNVNIYDNEGKPADGVKITIQSEALWGGYYYATWGITNSWGTASIILGDAQNFYLRIDGSLGSYPSFGTVQVISNSQAGATYTWECNLGGATIPLNVTQAPDYPDPMNNYLMEIDYQVDYETAYGTYFANNQFADKISPGIVDFFLANQENFLAYSFCMPAQAFSIFTNSSAGDISFVLPTWEPWYAVFSARELCTNRPRVSVHANIYRNTEASAPTLPEETTPTTISLNPAFPNPFNHDTEISFTLPTFDKVKIAVYDISGREVAVLTEQYYSPGTHHINWNGLSREERTIGSGIYLIRMTIDQQQFMEKVCLIK